MSETEFRHGKKRFYDTIKFPRGFAKSGNFTLSEEEILTLFGDTCLLYTSPSPRDLDLSRMPSSA